MGAPSMTSLVTARTRHAVIGALIIIDSCRARTDELRCHARQKYPTIVHDR